MERNSILGKVVFDDAIQITSSNVRDRGQYQEEVRKHGYTFSQCLLALLPLIEFQAPGPKNSSAGRSTRSQIPISDGGCSFE